MPKHVAPPADLARACQSSGFQPDDPLDLAAAWYHYTWLAREDRIATEKSRSKGDKEKVHYSVATVEAYRAYWDAVRATATAGYEVFARLDLASPQPSLLPSPDVESQEK